MKKSNSRFVRLFLERLNNKSAGFTLLELLTIISIISFFANSAIAVSITAREKARFGGALSFSQSVHQSFGATEDVRWTFDFAPYQCGIFECVSDESGNSNDGTILGVPEPIYVVGEGVNGGTITFAGTGSQRVMAPVTGGPWGQDSSWTVSVWARPAADVNTNAGIFASADASGDNTMEINIDHAGACPEVNFIKAIVRGTAAPADVICLERFIPNSWHFIVLSYDEPTNTLSGYLDGRLVHRNVAGTPNLDNSNIFQRYKIGINRTNSNTRTFKGDIDELNVYREALGVAQIQNFYVEGLEKLKLAGN